jgi:lipopolysaccharide transport system ATP-binding protein
MGPARFVIDEYLRRNGPDNNHTLNLFKMPRAFSPAGRLCLESFKWLCDVPLRHGEQVKALIQFQVASPLDDVSVGIGFSTIEGTRLLTYETDFPGGFRPSLSEPGTYSAQVEIDSLPLAPGNYVLDVGCRSGDAYALDYLPAATQLEIVPGPTTPGYIVRPDAGVRLASRWFWIS